MTRSPTHRRTRRFLVAATLFALAFTLAHPFGAQAVHDTGAFELDGNATSQTSDDWDKVCHQVTGSDCSTSSNTTSARAVAWSAEPNMNSTIFTGGGSKDPIDIDQWAWKDGAGGLPDKDNLQHAFAARYSLPPSAACPSGGASTCEVLFFGSDRFDNSGDAQQGFWFFQNEISLGSAKLGGGTSFNGVHRNGDLLVISNFSNGGTVSTITIYKWNSAVNGNLELLATSDSAKCTSATAGDAFCGLVNANDGTVAPWPFVDKSGNTTYLNGEFYEGGINLSLLGLGDECFASVSAETRSSTSTTATLKDFVLATFGGCTSSIATTAKDGSGNPIPPGGLSIGTGSVAVKDSATLTVEGAATWTGSVSFFLCGPIATGACDGTINAGTQIGLAQTVNQATTQPLSSDAATVTSVGRYCWRATFTSGTTGVPNASDDGSGTTPNPECFTVNPVQPTLTTQASGPVQLGNPISDTATLTGTASRPGTPIINPTTAGALAGGTITFTAYGPNNCTTVAYTNTVTVNGDGSYGSGSFIPIAVGTYTFVASYSGDSPNTLGVPTTACPDTTGTETVLVTDTTGIVTAQNWLPNDSATITTTGGSPLSGTLTLTLYGNGSCTGDALYSTGAVGVSGTSPQTVNSNNTTAKVSISTTVSWKAVFTSSNPNVAGSTSSCETTSLVINNN
jgi:hypothetical protein